MSLPVPRLDDLDFDRLVEDARALIPRYAPEWTDHNVHDPGITLLELLAWIVDQQIYQVGFVSDRHLRAFAALLGVRPRAAEPARGTIWPSNDAVLVEADLPRGSRVTCVQQPGIPFELAADVHVTPAKRTAAYLRATSGSVELSAFLQRPMSSFTHPTASGKGETELVFDQPLVTRGEDQARPGTIALGIEVDPTPSARSDSPTPWGPVAFEYRIGSSNFRTAVEDVEDGTFALARSGVVLLKIPSAPPEPKQPSYLSLRLDRGFFPVPPRIKRIELNVLPIVQLETQPQKVLDRRSNGMPDQAFELDLEHLPNQGPSESLPLHIEVEEEGRFTEWSVSQDLSQCGPQDRVYRLDTQKGRLVFGNGVNGRIPPERAQIRHKPYHLTQGADGNLTSGLSWRVTGAPGGGGAYGTNPAPLSGGADTWDTTKLLQEARQSVLNRKVLLADADLRRAAEALEGYGISRVEVLDQFHPRLPNQQLAGARSLVIVPWRDSAMVPPEPASDKYVSQVAAALAPYRVLGESLSVIAPRYVMVKVSAELLIADGFNGESVRKAADTRLNARLSDVAVDDEIAPWPLGRTVTCSEIKTLLATVPGVIAVPECLIAGPDVELAAAPSAESIELDRDEIAIGGQHRFRLTPFTDG